MCWPGVGAEEKSLFDDVAMGQSELWDLLTTPAVLQVREQSP